MPTLQNEIGYVIKHLQQSLRAMLDSALAVHSLTTAQYAVLYNLARHPGASSAELSRQSFVTPQTMMRIIRNLERRDFLVRTRSPRSSKSLEARLTPRGTDALRAAQREVDVIHTRMLKGFHGNELERLSSWLDRMIQNLEDS